MFSCVELVENVRPMKSIVQNAAVNLFGLDFARSVAFGRAATRQQSLILVYHRVLPDATHASLTEEPGPAAKSPSGRGL